ncbi:MAG: RagB/SusD family nutrient uptake outer membrane protein [Bacteroidaceae bacterium]|nr:RagB/SusD family nutrient uptake outer membrane protein [Bacteroidaceae bacterium]
MKKAILYSAMALATTLGMSSCGDDFLLIDPAGSVSEGTLTNDQGIDFVLTGAYASLNGMIGSPWNNPGNSLSNIVFGDVVGADANKGSTAGDQSDWTMLETYSFTSANSYIRDKWGAIYEAVKRCNNVMSMVQKGGDAITNPDLIIGQAQFIKSLWLFEGIRMYGAAIPYVSVEDYQANVDPQVSNVDESGNYVYIWDKVVADLQDAIAKLPNDWTATGEFGRANKWMAKALLGKVYLYWSSPYNGTNGTADHWADAKAQFAEVINSGVDAKGNKYKLANTYDELFHAATGDWTGESVIDCQMTLDGSNQLPNGVNANYYLGFVSGDNPGGGWGFYQPTSDFVNSFLVDADGLPAANYQSVPALTLTKLVDEGLETEHTDVVSDLATPTDPRLDVTVARFGVPMLDWGSTPDATWIRSFANGGPYLSKKQQIRRDERGANSLTNIPISSTLNYHYMRLADVYLMYAECAIHDGDLSTALEYINKVRARAANGFIKAEAGITKGNFTLDDKVNGKTVEGAAANYRIGLYKSFGSADEAKTALMRERRAEFGMEGGHWYDLARWGNIADELNKFIAFEMSSTGGQKSKYVFGYNSKMVTFPIPESEIQTAEGRFVQNPNWK